MSRFFLWAVLGCVCAAPARAQTAVAAGELPRAGAARPLRLLTATGAPLSGDARDVAWEHRGGGVFFTLDANGTRNIWRAFPDPQDSSRYPAWRALPVTNLRAPLYAEQAVPLPGDRALICVSNALSGIVDSNKGAQIVRYDLATAKWTPLSDAVRSYNSPAVAPDGTRVAFAENREQSNVYLASTQNSAKRVLPLLQTVASNARAPVWLSDDALLVESLRSGARGLYTVSLREKSASQLVVAGGGEASALAGSGIVFAAKTAFDAPPTLYLVAPDGSGLRALSGTAGARRPAIAPNGQSLAFDAPLNSTFGAARALWILPLERAETPPLMQTNAAPFGGAPVGAGNALLAANSTEPAAPLANDPLADAPLADAPLVVGREVDAPFALLSAVRALPGDGISILGAVHGPSNSSVALDVGQGEKPRRWETLPVTFPGGSAPVDVAGNRVLAIWNPPPKARGVWTLRLSLSGMGGGAQSLLRVKLPLPPVAATLPPPVALSVPRDGTAAAPATTLSTPPRAAPFQIPASPTTNGFLLPPAPASPVPQTNSRLGEPMSPIYPAQPDAQMPVFPAPVSPPPVFPAPVSLPPVAPVPVSPVPISPAPVAPVPVAPAPKPPVGVGVRDATASPSLNTAPAPPGKSPSPLPAKAPTPGDSTDFGAQFDISGTPARMAPGQKIKVTFWGQNRGDATWQTGATGADRVRLVARWVDFSTGTRRQWNFFWLKAPVAPAGRTKWDFDLTAPSRPGKYKLIFGLVRLPATGDFQPPPYSAAQQSWDGEFAAIAFAVEVAAP